jgi:CRISPR-associated protein Cas1
MMSRPDFMAKQVLFLESDNSRKIRFRNSNLVVEDEAGKTIVQHPIHSLFMVFVMGEFSITSVLLKNAQKHAVPIIFLSYGLKPYFSILPEDKGNFLLRKRQYTNKSDFEIAKHIVRNKIENQLFLMGSLRYKTAAEKEAIKKVKDEMNLVAKTTDSKELLGVEGTASKLFFETYFKNLGFKGRCPRTRQDIFNLLLDIGYHNLFNYIDANLSLYGFDTYCGVYHKFFFQRKSLVCDLVEPFRCIIDRRIRKSFNLSQIKESDFGFENGQYYLKREFNKKYSKLFLKEILKHKEEIFLYIQAYYRAFVREKEIQKYPHFTLTTK